MPDDSDSGDVTDLVIQIWHADYEAVYSKDLFMNYVKYI